MEPCCSPKCKREDKEGRAKKKAAIKALPFKLVRASDLKPPKKKAKTPGELLQPTQDIVNAFVKVRDFGKPCISCNTYGDEWTIWDAGHFRSIGSAGHLRFNVNNIHKQCRHCNGELSGNREGYEKGLIARIGGEKVEILLANNAYKKLTPEYCKRTRSIYRIKKNQIQFRRGSFK